MLPSFSSVGLLVVLLSFSQTSIAAPLSPPPPTTTLSNITSSHSPNTTNILGCSRPDHGSSIGEIPPILLQRRFLYDHRVPPNKLIDFLHNAEYNLMASAMRSSGEMQGAADKPMKGALWWDDNKLGYSITLRPRKRQFGQKTNVPTWGMVFGVLQAVRECGAEAMQWGMGMDGRAAVEGWTNGLFEVELRVPLRSKGGL